MKTTTTTIKNLFSNYKYICQVTGVSCEYNWTNMKHSSGTFKSATLSCSNNDIYIINLNMTKDAISSKAIDFGEELCNKYTLKSSGDNYTFETQISEMQTTTSVNNLRKLIIYMYTYYKNTNIIYDFYSNGSFKRSDMFNSNFVKSKTSYYDKTFEFNHDFNNQSITHVSDITMTFNTRSIFPYFSKNNYCICAFGFAKMSESFSISAISKISRTIYSDKISHTSSKYETFDFYDHFSMYKTLTVTTWQ